MLLERLLSVPFQGANVILQCIEDWRTRQADDIEGRKMGREYGEMRISRGGGLNQLAGFGDGGPAVGEP